MNASIAGYIGEALGFAILFALPAFIILISIMIKRTVSEKIPIWPYTIFFLLMMGLTFSFSSWLDIVFTFFIYSLCFFIDYSLSYKRHLA